MKSLVLSCIIAAILFSSLPVFYVLTTVAGQENTTIKAQNVDYNLPYPGILPDHPLYFVKAVRDKVVELITRDNLKKAKLYLSYSDKRISMAIKLADKGDHKLALTTLSKAEKYFLKIPQTLKDSKKQGVTPSQELVQQMKLSNEKHKEIIQSLEKQFPGGNNQEFNDILKVNQQAKDGLDSL